MEGRAGEGVESTGEGGGAGCRRAGRPVWEGRTGCGLSPLEAPHLLPLVLVVVHLGAVR